MSFKVIVAGGRNFTDYEFVKERLDYLLARRKNVVIVSGACNTGKVTYIRPDGTKVCGADGLGERYAAERNIPTEVYPAEWEKYGKSAGYRRNEVMAKIANAAACFWDGKSRGTGHMIDLARQYKLIVREIRY